MTFVSDCTHSDGELHLLLRERCGDAAHHVTTICQVDRDLGLVRIFVDLVLTLEHRFLYRFGFLSFRDNH